MTIRKWLALGAMLLLPAGLRAQAAAPDTARADTAAADPVREFMYDLVDPMALATAAAMGLYDHLIVEPYEWGGGVDALSQRMLSRAGGHVVETSVRHGLAAALGRSTHEEPCRGCASAEDHVRHALMETFTDLEYGGRRVISEPFLAGSYAGAIAPQMWHPEGSLWNGVKDGTMSVLFSATWNVLFALLESAVPPRP